MARLARVGSLEVEKCNAVYTSVPSSQGGVRVGRVGGVVPGRFLANARSGDGWSGSGGSGGVGALGPVLALGITVLLRAKWRG